MTDYRYTPGAQQCGARNGFWLTPPADNITITNFTSSGEGGKVGIIGAKGVGKVAKNVTIRGMTMTASSGYTLTIGDVSNFLLINSTLGHNNIVIDAQAIAEGTVSHCTYGQMVRSGARSAQVHLAVVS